MLVLGRSTALYEPLPPDAAGAAIGAALASGADGVALQMLPYWRTAQCREFREYYRPQLASWPSLWDHDGALRGLFRGE